MSKGYDTSYQDWLKARQANDYQLADSIRDQFEYDHGLTIFAEGAMPIENVTVRRMTEVKWLQKFKPNNTGLIHAQMSSDGTHQSAQLNRGYNYVS
jgi:hypothetical protein